MNKISLDTGHDDGRSGGPSSPMEMHPPHRRAPLPLGPLECPWCLSPDLDEEARQCQRCETVVPYGASLHRAPRRITTKDQRIDLASRTQDTHRNISAPTWRRGR